MSCSLLQCALSPSLTKLGEGIQQLGGGGCGWGVHNRSDAQMAVDAEGVWGGGGRGILKA